MERLDKEKREEISQMKIRFYVNISHELRTPLTLIVAPYKNFLVMLPGIGNVKNYYISNGTRRDYCIW